MLIILSYKHCNAQVAVAAIPSKVHVLGWSLAEFGLGLDWVWIGLGGCTVSAPPKPRGALTPKVLRRIGAGGWVGVGLDLGWV